MELQDQTMSDWSQYYLPPASLNHHFLFSDLKSSCMWPQGKSDAYCNIWANTEPTRVKSCSSGSFAMDARIRLDSLKSGCNPPLPYCATSRMLHNYSCEKHSWDSEELQEEETALDLVEILDIADEEQDEESWLYESPRKHSFVEKKESAFKWCRHVLDNPSPEMEAACRVLIKMLDQGSRRELHKRPAVPYHAASVPVGSSVNKTSASAAANTPDSSGHSEPSISLDVVTKSYRLQDVHIMAQLQEASLRQDFVSMPSTASQRRNPEPPVKLPPSFNTTDENTGYSTLGNKSETSSSISAVKECCQSPRPSILHQQVTQFKLLKRAQNQAAGSPGRTRSPLRTSLRSLQAVRNSRSLDIDDCQSADQTAYLPSDLSSARGEGLSCWLPSFSPASLNSGSLLQSMKSSSVQTAAVKKMNRSHSLSPCRIPQSAKGCLSVHRRVFTSPERLTTVAWGRNLPVQR
ncbi:SLAIN motif-containing protein-like isoform X1 [Oreochromis niloticus]|uniref:SLAIN motif-containing protein-like n=1 Tax=Oreochromis niloticus TaxID=8128 RepID=A0A669ETM6_ORENI|nr:SLAIN motif-containing protein-like isoform X1 [Oreochromis niloticus]